MADDAADDDVADEIEEPALTEELDLHTFLPRECADVVEEYVRAAHEAGLRTVRIVHGKGTGTLRRIVHGVLERHPAVRTFQLADARSGSWGATIVELRDAPAASSPDKPSPDRPSPGGPSPDESSSDEPT